VYPPILGANKSPYSLPLIDPMPALTNHRETMRGLFLAICLMSNLQVNSQQPPCPKKMDVNVSYDFYVGVGNEYRTLAQPVGENFGFSQSAIPIVDDRANIKATPLCDGGIVAAWLRDSSRERVFLMARIFDDRLQPRTDGFRVTESNEAQWEHSVGTLHNGNFVVAWKSYITGKNGKPDGIKIRARVFDHTGHAIMKSINVSSSPGNNDGQARVYGLFNGDFFVLWYRFGKGVFLRVFSGTGTPRIPETLVVTEGSGAVIPYGYVNGASGFHVFAGPNNELREQTPFLFARGYNALGMPVTDVITGESISQLPGYQITVERVVREIATRIDGTMQEFLQKDVMGFRFCEFETNLMVASKIKTFSSNLALHRFAGKYYQTYKSNCPSNKYIERDLEQCLKNN
jgi:hypothetical protein